MQKLCRVKTKSLITITIVICSFFLISISSQVKAETITIDGNFDDWIGINPILSDPAGDAMIRDIISASVVSQGQNLYFKADFNEFLGGPFNATLRTNDGSLYLIIATASDVFLMGATSLTEDNFHGYPIVTFGYYTSCSAFSGDMKSLEFCVPLADLGNPTKVDLVFWGERPSGPYGYDRAPDVGYVTYEISIISEDIDSDGILNDVDMEPLIYSDSFTDENNGGSTWGLITFRGDQILTIRDEPATTEEDFGVRITASPSGGERPANISIAGQRPENTSFYDCSLIVLGPGDEIIVTHGSIKIKVISGDVDASFIADDGTIATAELNEGTDLVFEPSSTTFINIGEIDATVKIDNVEYSIPAGNEWFTSSLELEPNTLNLKSNGNYITAFIELPSSHDINEVEISSIILQVAGYSYNVDLSAAISIGDYNGNGISDLMIKFQRQPVVNNLKILDYSTLSGKSVDMIFAVSGSLTDGTSFGCSDTLRILNLKK